VSWLLVPLVLFLPGYAIAALAFPPGTIGVAERGVYAVALSIAAAAVGGLVLQLAIGLDRTSWAALLFVITAVCAAQGVRLGRYPRPQPPRRPWALPFVVAAFAAAALVTALAIVSARDGVIEARAQSRFTDFWLAPSRPAGAEPATTFAVGLRNHEGGASRYVLRVFDNGRPLARREVVLAPGEQRVWGFAAPTAVGRVVASLRRDGGASRDLYLPLGS
jgi:Protein of unknown function (DUF1616)